MPEELAPTTPEPAASAPAVVPRNARSDPRPTDVASTPSVPPCPRVPSARWRGVVCPQGVLPAAGVAGLGAAVCVPADRPGIGWVLAGSVAAVAVFAVDRRARQAVAACPGSASDRPAGSVADGTPPVRNWGRIWWTALALALLAVGAFRAAEWLFTLCVAAACVAGSIAVVGRRSANGIWFDAIAVPLVAVVGIPWAYASLGARRGGQGVRARRMWLSAVVTVALLVVFAPLLAAADATFASVLSVAVPQLETASVVQWIALFGVVGLGALGAMYLLACPPVPALGEPGAGRSLRPAEWGLPVGALTVLFAVFVGVQFVALFGGDDYVQRTAGLTYAEYARSGFWQLSVVTILALAVILVVLRWAAQDSVADRSRLRVLLCVVSGLSLIIVGSALGRMWTYQQAYGFTVLRLLVEVCELWIGLVYLLAIGAVLRLDRSWLARAAVGTAMASLLALALLNPERLIADQNIDRWRHGHRLDTGYLSSLSPDALPALIRLPDPLRNQVTTPIRHIEHDSWQSWNLSRTNAR